MSQEPDLTYEMPAFGLASAKREGETIDYGHPTVPSVRREPSWLSRKTEWPRRNLARWLERLADRICTDRDEGWR